MVCCEWELNQTPIHFIVECTIAEGRVETFQKVAREIITLIQETEPNTQIYQWYLNEAGTKCIIHEVYPDSETMLAHGQVKDFRILLSQLVKIAPITQFYILGDLSEKAKQRMAAVASENLCIPFAGFTRWHQLISTINVDWEY